jgi:hypothetical protein
MPETTNIEEKQITEEILLTTSNNKKQAISKKPTNNNSNNIIRKPPVRSSNQINSYNNKHSQQNYQNMTVRINPLIFKQQQNSQPFQISFTKHKQQQQQQKQQLKKPQVAFEMISNLSQHHNHHNNNYLNQNLIEQNNQFEFGHRTNEFLNNDTHLCLETIVDTFQANK